MVKNIFVFRHGDAGPPDLCKGNKLDYPLSPQGLEQTRANVRVLVEAARGRALEIMVSPSLRCVAAKEFVPRNVRFRVLPELRDIDIGDLEGKTYGEVERLFPGLLAQLKTDARARILLPGAEESIPDFRERVLWAYGEAVQSDADVTGVITHGCDKEEIIANILGGPVRYLRHKHAAGSLIRLEDGYPEVLVESKALYDGEAPLVWPHFTDTSLPLRAPLA